MIYTLSHEVDNNPEQDDADTIRLTATIIGQDDNSTFTTVSFARDFIDDENDECKSKEDLNYFLLEAGINEDVMHKAILELIVYVEEITCPTSVEYSRGCSLNVRLDLIPDYLADDDSRVQEAVQVSFDDTSNIRFRPANKLAVKSLPRKVYNKKIKKEKKKKISSEECMICLQEFSNGGVVVTLSCGHEFDDECIVKWFETSHVCPLCRFELPCEDEL